MVSEETAGQVGPERHKRKRENIVKEKHYKPY